MKSSRINILAAAALLISATAAIAGNQSTAVTLDANSPLGHQGWEQLGGIAPTVQRIGGKQILVFDDQSTSDSSGCVFTLPEALVQKALEKGFSLTFTARWEGRPLPHNIELLLGETRIFLTLNSTQKEQNVIVLGYGERVSGSVARPDRFHTWRLVRTAGGDTELYVNRKKVASAFVVLHSDRERKTGRFSIGGVHGLSRERVGRLELESASFEILD